MGFKKYKWHKVAGTPAELEWSAGDISVVEVEGKKVCIGKYGEEWWGFAYACPHAGGIMADGYIDPAGNVVCPIHSYKFSLKNGRNSSGEGYHLKRYPVECRPDGVFLGLEEGGFFRWL